MRLSTSTALLLVAACLLSAAGAQVHDMPRDASGQPAFDFEGADDKPGMPADALPPRDEMEDFLRELWPKIDTDGDEVVSREELAAFLAQRELDIQKQTASTPSPGGGPDFAAADVDVDGKVTLDEYLDWLRNLISGSHAGQSEADIDAELKYVREYEESAFKGADKDGDGALNEDEFNKLMHPETELLENAGDQEDYQKEVTEQYLGERDLDADGSISWDEYWSDADRYTPGEEELAQLEAEERALFDKFDEDDDGLLSPEELRSLLFKHENDFVGQQVDNIFLNSDLNKDNVLMLEEVLKQADLVYPEMEQPDEKTLAEAAAMHPTEQGGYMDGDAPPHTEL